MLRCEETPLGGRPAGGAPCVADSSAAGYYGSQSAHSFFAQQLRALQKMPLPGLHFPLPSWTDLSSSTHVALVVGFRRSAARFANAAATALRDAAAALVAPARRPLAFAATAARWFRSIVKGSFENRCQMKQVWEKRQS